MSSEEKSVKIVVHVSGVKHEGEEDKVYGENGVVFHEFLKPFLNKNVELEYISFAGMFLGGQVLHDFMSECASADIIIIDCWNQPINNLDWINNSAFDPDESMAEIAEKLRNQNPQTKIFAQLYNPFEGIDDNDEETMSQMDIPKQRVHDFAIPFNDIIEKNIIDAIESAIKKVA